MLTSTHPELAEKVQRQRITPFVGAGVSQAVQDVTGKPVFPNWKDLLHDAADLVERESPSHASLIRNFLKLPVPRYYDAAGTAREQLGDRRWYEFLLARLGVGKERIHPASLELGERIWGLGSRLVITTNCDDVLRWACPAQPVIWNVEQPFRQASALRNGVKEHTIWHLHGNLSEPEKTIFTLDDYQLLYPDDSRRGQYHAALQTLHTYLLTSTFIFIGFSMDDPYFGNQMRAMDRAFSGLSEPHYVITKRIERGRIERLGLNLRIVEVDDYGLPLLQLLSEMAELAGGGRVMNLRDAHADAPTLQIPRIGDYSPARPTFHVPHPRKQGQMVGREDDMRVLRAQLVGGFPTPFGRTAALQGLGGLGKTQFAVEYAYLYRSTYSGGVVWVSADQSIGSQLIKLAEDAGWVAPESDQAHKIDVAARRLRAHPDTLVIFDNVARVGDIEPYLPLPSTLSHILITSRTHQEGFVPVPLRLLDYDESLDMLVREAGRQPAGDVDMEAARQIARKMGGLPLALELAGAYLRLRPISWAKYRKLLDYNLRSALRAKLRGFTRHEADLYSTLKIGEAVFREEPRLRKIMDVLVCSGRAPMSLALLASLMEVHDTSEIAGPLALGTALGFLRSVTDGEAYEVQSLVAKVRRDSLNLSKRVHWLAQVATRIGDWFEGQLDGFADPRAFDQDVEHLEAWYDNAVTWVPEEACRLAWLLHYPPYFRGRFKNALGVLSQAVKAWEGSQRKDRNLKAHLESGLSQVQYQLNAPQQALAHAQAALALRQELNGPEHAETASALSDLSVIFRALKDDDRALVHGKQALRIRLKLLGKAHPETAESANNLALIYRSLGKNHVGLRYARRALGIYRRSLGMAHPYTATAYGNVGVILHNLKEYTAARCYAGRSLRLRLQILGPKHPSTATSYHNLGVTLKELEELEDARRSLTRAVRIRRELLGFAHVNTCLSIRALAEVLALLGRCHEAVHILKRCLRTIRPDHGMRQRLEETLRRCEVGGST
jgi:tetratricopeptide (TPR) repeat protein